MLKKKNSLTKRNVLESSITEYTHILLLWYYNNYYYNTIIINNIKLLLLDYNLTIRFKYLSI